MKYFFLFFSRDNVITIWDVTAPAHFAKTPRKLPRFLPKMTLRGPDSFLLVSNLWINRVEYSVQKYLVMTRTGQLKALHAKSAPYYWINPRGNADQEMNLVIPRYYLKKHYFFKEIEANHS